MTTVITFVGEMFTMSTPASVVCQLCPLGHLLRAAVDLALQLGPGVRLRALMHHAVQRPLRAGVGTTETHRVGHRRERLLQGRLSMPPRSVEQ